MSFRRTVGLKNDVLDFIVHTSQLVDEDLLQRKGENVKIGRVHRCGAAADLVCIAPNNEGP
jgi:hypothetical protein